MSSKSGDDRNHWWLITPASKWELTQWSQLSVSQQINWFSFLGSNQWGWSGRLGSQKNNGRQTEIDKFSKHLYSLLARSFEQYLSHSPVPRFICSMMRFPLFERKLTQEAIPTIYSILCVYVSVHSPTMRWHWMRPIQFRITLFIWCLPLLWVLCFSFFFGAKWRRRCTALELGPAKRLDAKHWAHRLEQKTTMPSLSVSLMDKSVVDIFSRLFSSPSFRRVFYVAIDECLCGRNSSLN